MTHATQPLFAPGLITQIAELLHVETGEVLRFGIRLVTIWLLAWLAVRLLRVVARRIEQAVDDGDPNTDTAEEKRGRTLAQLIRYVGRVAVVAVALLMSVNVFVDIGPLLAGAGILGLAISFGAQSLVKDVISGFFILIENQFSVGDVIEAGGKTGTVEKMSLRLVTLRDQEGRLHMVPNGEIKVVSNMTRGWSRAVVDVGVAYEEDVDRALAVIGHEARGLAQDPAWAPLFDGEPEVVGVNELGDSAVVIRTLLRTQPGKQWLVAREFRRRIKVRFQREELEIPYQKRKVQVQVQGAGTVAPEDLPGLAGGAA